MGVGAEVVDAEVVDAEVVVGAEDKFLGVSLSFSIS